MGSNRTVVASPVTVSLSSLESGNVPLSTLEEAFGPESLGIIVVKDLSARFMELRQRLLSYSSYLGNLSPTQLAQLENAKAKYLVGWSLGKETLKDGQSDNLKGSYYVNCAFYQDPALQGAPADNYPSFPEYTAPNVWPAEEILPGFRKAFQELCTLIIDTAILVARACDSYGLKNVEGYEAGYLEHVVRTSMTTKARLLHYFPSVGSAATDETDGNDQDQDDWCATHVDHGCLTGLTSAMFIDETSESPHIAASASTVASLAELPKSPDPQAGLYIHSRTSQVAKVSIPRDCLAFQTGAALEAITRGKFRAVPHFVRGARAVDGMQIARNTLAVFTQPNLWEVVDRERGLDFAAFAREIVAKNTVT